jgi:osmotically-inducible protein OsmY
VVVSKGWITLNGEVQWGHQSAIAEKVARSVRGVTGVTNAIKVRPEAICAEVAEGVRKALEQYASIEVEAVKVEVQGAKVKLAGQVNGSEAYEAIKRAAWTAPGVRAVEDHISVG